MSDAPHFYRVTRQITQHGNRYRLTEITVVGQRVAGQVKIIACYGKSTPYTPNTNAADHAA